MISQDTWVMVVKYTASLAAAGYGVYATLNDFHEERGGKKVLARAGYFGIGFLVLSSLLGICSDLFKDSKERAAARIEEAKREQLLNGETQISSKLGHQLEVSGRISTQVDASVAALHDQIQETQTVLITARRASMPLPQNLLMTVRLGVPSRQTVLLDYVRLLESSPPTYPKKGPEIWIDSVLNRQLIPRQSDSPGEISLNALFLKSHFDVMLLDSLPRRWTYADEIANSQLRFQADCSEEYVNAIHSHPPGPFRPTLSDMVYRPKSHLLSISCGNLPAVESSRKGTLSSLLDFGGKYLVLRVGEWEKEPAGGRIGKLLQGNDLQFDLQSVELVASFSTHLTVNGFHRRLVAVSYGKESRPVLLFVARIPDNVQWDQ